MSITGHEEPLSEDQPEIHVSQEDSSRSQPTGWLRKLNYIVYRAAAACRDRWPWRSEKVPMHCPRVCATYICGVKTKTRAVAVAMTRDMRTPRCSSEGGGFTSLEGFASYIYNAFNPPTLLLSARLRGIYLTHSLLALFLRTLGRLQR